MPGIRLGYADTYSFLFKYGLLHRQQGMSICLNMIVKNEAHILPKTLPMLCQHFKFSYWVISDTGSTDGTQELIRAFFKERGIPGEVIETPWKNFGYNRSIAFEAAYNKSDYVLVWDADDSIVGTFNLPEKLVGDAYEFEFGEAGGFRYSRLQLFNNHKRWKYVGVLHEYPAPLDTLGPVTHVSGDYYFVSGREGARNKDPDKYKKDAIVLEEGLLEEPDNTRHVFYCANSYMNAGDYDNAIRMYKKVLAMDGWTEEKYIASSHLFECGLKKDETEQYLHYLVNGTKYSPGRVEGIGHLVRYYCVKDMHRVACAYYNLVKDVYEKGYTTAQISKYLFAKKQEFDFFLPYYMIIAGTKAGEHGIAAQMLKHICKMKYAADAWHTRNVFHNMRFIEGLKPELDLLFSMLEYRDLLPADGFEAIQNGNISAYIQACLPLLTAPSKPLTLSNRNSKPRVLLTIECTDIDRFTKTMNSILRTWTDFGSVDAFYCQKGRLSVQQSKQLRERFPFFEFGVVPARSYATSVDTEFWIHLDEDSMFVRRDAYVTRSIDILTRYETNNVHQVLYNRNYALTYNDWNIQGAGEELEKGVLTHAMKVELASPSCGLWPHFAMRPGCTRFSKRVEIDSDADKLPEWATRGWKTCFFNTISHVHHAPGVNQCILPPDQIQFWQKSQIVDASNIFIINLERRPDRRKEIEKKFRDAGVNNYVIARAVDGKELVATSELAKLFNGNNFGNRRGILGASLSHYRLWQRLCGDKTQTHYAIFEDDIDIRGNIGQLLKSCQKKCDFDMLFLGCTFWDEKYRFTGNSVFEALDMDRYVGGAFGYIITQDCARRLCKYIEENGCKVAIDWVTVACASSMNMQVTQPHMVITEWARSQAVDSNIQHDYDTLDLSQVPKDTQIASGTTINWRFIPGMDSFGNDIKCIGRKPIKELLMEASTTENCVAVNTLGYLKHKVESSLIKPACFGAEDGVFIRVQ